MLTVCGDLGWSDYMSIEIIILFVALFVHIPVYFCLLLLIDVKKSGGTAADAFPCLKSCSSHDDRLTDAEAPAADVFQGKGDSDVHDENIRVQRLLRDPENSPVVLIHVTIVSV